MLLILAAVVGVPVSAAAYFFLALVSKLQGWVFTSLPKGLGFQSEPVWWPILPLVLAGLLVGLTIRYLPGRGGHSPADGFKAGGGAPSTIELPGIVLAAFTTLSLGVVLGPEGPLIALGAGLGALAVRLVKRDAPDRVQSVLAAAGSFAAISTLLGSPLTGAFLLMEASGLGGPMMQLVLVPGLLAAGVGSLIFIGLNAWTGLGTFALAIPGLPPVGNPTGGEFLWALAIGIVAVPVGTGIRWLALLLRPHVERRMVLLTPVVGLAIAGLAIAFAEGTGKPSSEVLFSGQSALGPLITNSASYSVGALLLLIVCKGLAYGMSRAPSAAVRPSRPFSSVRRAASRVSPGGAVPYCRRRHGHRRHVRRDAQIAADLRLASLPAAGVGRPESDAAGDRGGRGRLRGVRLAYTNPVLDSRNTASHDRSPRTAQPARARSNRTANRRSGQTTDEAADDRGTWLVTFSQHQAR